MANPISYAFAIFDKQQAPWRATLEEANCDALDADMATIDEHREDRVWITVPGDILRTMDPVITEPRGLAPLHQPIGRPLEGSRIERIIARRSRAA